MSAAAGSTAGSSLSRGILWLLLPATVVILLALAGDPLREELRWSREALSQGEWWRLVTGHIVHLDVMHAFLNLVAAALLFGIFGASFGLRRALLAMLTGMIAIDLGLWFLGTVDWYVGLSGILHAYAAAAVVRSLIDRPDRTAMGIAVFGMGKIVWENTVGALPFVSAETIVVTDAHLFGVLAGLLVGLLTRSKRQSIGDE